MKYAMIVMVMLGYMWAMPAYGQSAVNADGTIELKADLDGNISIRTTDNSYACWNDDVRAWSSYADLFRQVAKMSPHVHNGIWQRDTDSTTEGHCNVKLQEINDVLYVHWTYNHSCRNLTGCEQENICEPIDERFLIDTVFLLERVVASYQPPAPTVMQIERELISADKRWEARVELVGYRVAGGIFLGSGLAGFGISLGNGLLYRQLENTNASYDGTDYLKGQKDRALAGTFIAGGAGIVSIIISACFFADADGLSKYNVVRMVPSSNGLAIVGEW